MKKKLIVLSILAAFAATAISGTVAFNTVVGTAHNVITSGNVKIKLIEKMELADGTQIDYPTDAVNGVMPGKTMSKIVTVENTGDADAWIRVHVECTMKDKSGNLFPEVIAASGSNGTVNIPVMELDIDSDTWLAGEDDYYYYREILKAGETTTTLFEHVTFAGEMGNDYQGSQADIKVRAEAVQSKNNLIPEGQDVTDVKGWPKSEGGV